MGGKAWGLTVEIPVQERWKALRTILGKTGAKHPELTVGEPRKSCALENERPGARHARSPECSRIGELFQGIADVLEGGVKCAADTVHGRDDGDRNAGSNEAILDGRSC